jgi:hypothetical protein
MRKVFAVTAAIALLCLGSLAQANITIDTVPVGNAGNLADTLVMDDSTTGYGSVAYNYNIGKYEVTAGQYTAFLNSKATCNSDLYGLYDSRMGSGCGITQSGSGTVATPYVYTVDPDFVNRPVNYVSYWDSCRFANWLGNGQGDSDTETGAYTMTSEGIEYNTITRNAGATWAVTSEDEWYKAAYYMGSGYSLYANGTGDAPDAGTTGSNYSWFMNSTWDVGSGFTEQNGTKDMMGNVWEWNEAIIGSYRGLRGGSFTGSGDYYSQASIRNYDSHYDGFPTGGYSNIGFRVSEVPEPSSIIALAGGLISLLGIRRRRA